MANPNPFRERLKVWIYEHRIGAFRFGDLCMSESRVGGTPGAWYVPESKLKKVKAERDQAKAQALAELQEGLKPAVAAMASISAATGRARATLENPDMDGFTVDEELDEIAAQVKVLRAALSILDQEGEDGQ